MYRKVLISDHNVAPDSASGVVPSWRFDQNKESRIPVVAMIPETRFRRQADYSRRHGEVVILFTPDRIENAVLLRSLGC
jgi:hypothetical protein